MDYKKITKPRSDIQNAIIPRNFIFGRLSYVRVNILNIIQYSKKSLTLSEMSELTTIANSLLRIINKKQENSEIIKEIIIKKKKREEENEKE